MKTKIVINFLFKIFFPICLKKNFKIRRERSSKLMRILYLITACNFFNYSIILRVFFENDQIKFYVKTCAIYYISKNYEILV